MTIYVLGVIVLIVNVALWRIAYTTVKTFIHFAKSCRGVN